MLLSDSPVDLATATNSPRPKKREQASAAFPFDRVIVEPFTFSDSATLEGRASTYFTKISIAKDSNLRALCCFVKATTGAPLNLNDGKAR